MKVSKVVVAAGAGFTSVPCTIGAHRTRMYDESSGRLQLDYQTLDDNFTETRSTVTNESNVISLTGHGESGVIGRPVDWAAKGTPASADIIAKVRTTAAAGCTLIIEEFEQ